MSFPKIDGYIVTEKLGSGSYSTVYKAYTKVGARSVVAIKCVDKSRIKNSGSAVDNLITEIRLLKTLTHPHIVEMKNFTWDDRNIYIIMEFCCGGDLSKYIHKYGRVPEQRVLYFLQQLAAALKFLREKGVVHMDLKPHNLLLHKDSNGRYVLKVADFGFAQHMSLESMRSVRGSPLYMAPEMLAGEYDARVDLWSVGVIMYECLFGKAPYSSSTFKELVDKIQKQAPIEIPRNASISSGCRDLLLRLLQHDPDARISYEEFFTHPYLDLEYMPSKENYEKAVALIKQAVELDCSGRAREALACYSEGLRYLVPAVGAETDADRRGALAAKLARYMERAEEIKQLLKGDTPAAKEPAQDGNLQPRQVSCCGRNINLSDRHNSTRQVCNPCACTSKQSDSSSEGCSCSTQHRGIEEKPASIQENANSSPSTRSSPKPSRTHFGLRRFFGRQASLPFLDSKDSSITAETQNDKKPGSAENNDACRIT